MRFPLLRASFTSLAALALPPVSAAQAASDISLAPTANVQYEATQVSVGDQDETEDGFRRARLGFKLKGKAWQLVAEHDFADKTPSDAYLELTPAEGHSLRVGQFKQPFMLEDAVSDKHSAILEASLISPFAISRRIGAEYARQFKLGTLYASVFGQRLDGTNESIGVAARATRLLRSSEHEEMHVGISVASEQPDNERASFRASPGTTFTDLRAASSGTLTAVDHIHRAAVEGVWLRDALTVQAELAGVSVVRDGADFHGNGGSVQVAWSPTGHMRSYKRGVIGAPVGDGIGWELAARLSTIDLDDGSVRGGQADSYGLGVVCTFNPYARVLFNVVRTDLRHRSDDPTVAGVRLQLTY